MYRGSPSPIFDAPEFPTLRRVKPLPKRRRTMAGLSYEQHGLPLSPAAASALAAQGASALLQQSAAAALHQHQQQQPLDLLSPNVTAEELLAHADTLSARMALQNYYMPILGGMQSFLNGTAGGDASGNGGNSNAGAAAAAAAAALAAVAGAGRNGQMPIPLPDLDSIDFGVHFAAAAAAAAAAGVAMGGLNSLGMGLPGMNTGMGMGGPSVAEHHTSAAAGSRGGSRRYEDEGRGDGDYIDHLQQPGNTKKRKVPANAGGSPRGLGGDGGRTSRPSSPFLEDDVGGGGFSGPEGDAYRDRDRDRDRDRGRDYDGLPASQAYPPPSFPGQISMVVAKKGKLSAAALAGLQHKELLKSRKRQLAAVLGALSHGDTLALDQALSASYPLVGLGSPGAGDAPRVRKSRRTVIRLSRVIAMTRVPRHPDAVPLASSDFLFACPSATADRLIATKEEVTMLRNRFEAELERQAAKAAKMAVAAASGKSLSKSGGRGKRERVERDRERAEKAQRRAEKQQKTKTANGGTETREDPTGQSDPLTVASAMGNGGKTKNGKKKKRSALANASNPHHLRNYVPSRLPHTGAPGGGEGGAAAAGAGANPNTIWPLPLRFLSAEIPPRKRKKAPVVPLVQLTHPADEWICAFCEYDLFYGEEPQYRRGVRNRKKILRRRRRARERAAAAASGAPGTSTAKVPPPPPPSEEYDGYEPCMTGDEYGSAAPQRGTKWKGDPNKDQAAFG